MASPQLSGVTCQEGSRAAICLILNHVSLEPEADGSHIVIYLAIPVRPGSAASIQKGKTTPNRIPFSTHLVLQWDTKIRRLYLSFLPYTLWAEARSDLQICTGTCVVAGWHSWLLRWRWCLCSVWLPVDRSPCSPHWQQWHSCPPSQGGWDSGNNEPWEWERKKEKGTLVTNDLPDKHIDVRVAEWIDMALKNLCIPCFHINWKVAQLFCRRAERP